MRATAMRSTRGEIGESPGSRLDGWGSDLSSGKHKRWKTKRGSWLSLLRSEVIDPRRDELWLVVRAKTKPGVSNPSYLQKARDFMYWCHEVAKPRVNPKTATADDLGRYFTAYALGFRSSTLPQVKAALLAVARDNADWVTWSEEMSDDLKNVIKKLRDQREHLEEAYQRTPLEIELVDRIGRTLAVSSLADLQFGARLMVQLDGMMRPQDCAVGRCRWGDTSFHEARLVGNGPARIYYYSRRVRAGKTSMARTYHSAYEIEDGAVSAYWWLAKYRELLRVRAEHAPTPEDYEFPLIVTDAVTGAETVDWARPMSDASFMAEVKLRALRVGAPREYVAKLVPYSSRSGGVRWRFGQKPPKEREWIKRRGGWLSDAYRFYERLTPGGEALEAMGLDAAELAGDLFEYISEGEYSRESWPVLKTFPVAEQQNVQFVARAVARGRPANVGARKR